MQELIRKLIDSGCMRSERIIEAFGSVDRADFVPEELKSGAYEDTALPIGYGQTISQPCVVAFMLELLHPERGDYILDVGSGSGWQTALLSHIVGKEGRVVAIERVPEVFRYGQERLAKYGFENIDLIEGDGTIDIQEEKYFDKIIAAASGSEVPEAFKRELKIGGTLVIPIRESIFILKKIDDTHFSEREFPGFLFVPLIRDQLR